VLISVRGTNWYDQAHSETILESLDFDYDDDTDWRCILGGAQQLALKMEDYITHKPDYLTRATAIRSNGIMNMEVEFENLTSGWKSGKHTRTYSGVFSSTTLGCLKRIDTSSTHLNSASRQGIRSLGYGPSAKVGIKFSRAWWIHDLDNGYCITQGGLGHSDLTIRTCVYPSYNINDPKDKPAVLLCSYTWQQDAERIGALMSSSSDHEVQLQEEGDLKERLFRDLARLHNYKQTKDAEDKLYDMISSSYLDHYAHDWTHDPNTAGAFAFFRPQQFTNFWNKMIYPDGDLVLIGEALSAHHAWVVGALESAVYGVYAWLSRNSGRIDGAKEAKETLETAKKGNPFAGLPGYIDLRAAAANAMRSNLASEEHFEGRV
jgi:monoamine oxidase